MKNILKKIENNKYCQWADKKLQDYFEGRPDRQKLVGMLMLPVTFTFILLTTTTFAPSSAEKKTLPADKNTENTQPANEEKNSQPSTLNLDEAGFSDLLHLSLDFAEKDADAANENEMEMMVPAKQRLNL